MRNSGDNGRYRTCFRGGKPIIDGTVLWQTKDIRCPYKLGDFVYKLGEPRDYEYLLLCDGSTISEENYPELCELLGGTQLPNLIGRVLQGDSVGGEYKEAGLPNITGSFSGGTATTNFSVSNTDKAFRAESNGATQAGPHYNSGWHAVTFDASRSSSIYGASSTVQPPAYTAKIYICYAG